MHTNLSKVSPDNTSLDIIIPNLFNFERLLCLSELNRRIGARCEAMWSKRVEESPARLWASWLGVLLGIVMGKGEVTAVKLNS